MSVVICANLKVRKKCRSNQTALYDFIDEMPLSIIMKFISLILQIFDDRVYLSISYDQID